MLIIHLKIFRNNYFLIISNTIGKILFTINSGQVGFKNISKCSIESLKIILQQGFKFFIGLKKKRMFFKLEVSIKYILYEIYKQFLIFFQKYKTKIPILKIINKISHSGLRKKFFK
jgi:hypothetical protein